MPSNQTANYALSQWSRTDQVKMEDFNADNAKLDAALKAEADARTAADAAINQTLSKKGNCSIGTFTYTGTGTCGPDNPTRITFPRMPIMYFILGDKFLMGRGGVTGAVYAYSVSSGGTSVGDISASWSGNTVSFWDSKFPARQMNENSVVYQVIAFYAEG